MKAIIYTIYITRETRGTHPALIDWIAENKDQWDAMSPFQQKRYAEEHEDTLFLSVPHKERPQINVRPNQKDGMTLGEALKLSRTITIQKSAFDSFVKKFKQKLNYDEIELREYAFEIKRHDKEHFTDVFYKVFDSYYEYATKNASKDINVFFAVYKKGGNDVDESTVWGRPKRGGSGDQLYLPQLIYSRTLTTYFSASEYVEGRKTGKVVEFRTVDPEKGILGYYNMMDQDYLKLMEQHLGWHKRERKKITDENKKANNEAKSIRANLKRSIANKGKGDMPPEVSAKGRAKIKENSKKEEYDADLQEKVNVIFAQYQADGKPRPTMDVVAEELTAKKVIDWRGKETKWKRNTLDTRINRKSLIINH